ncbi:MAG: DoxX family membrane protein [Phycisphaerae bacterium]|nr:DoxX family membrane protein [Phycisphaerae bacterium]
MTRTTATGRSQAIADGWALAAMALLGARFTQGFIFWGGATRRLIYDWHETAGTDYAVKLDFNGPGFVAAKLTHALPGALWVQGPIEWTLRHPDLIIASVWMWTFAELAVGLGLMLGLATRLAALASIGLNVVLMVIFGWMGSTCLDEWTMAVSGVAMSAAVFIAGAGAYSIDERYIGSTAWARSNAWSNWAFSGTLPARTLHKVALWLGLGCIAFTVLTYHLLFGAVVSPLHARTNFHKHNIALSVPIPASDGGVRFDARVDAGPDTGAAYIVAARLLDDSGNVAAEWDGAALARLPQDAIVNAYTYVWASKFKTEKIGFSGQTGARASISLPAPTSAPTSSKGLILELEAIDGAKWRSAPAR